MAQNGKIDEAYKIAKAIIETLENPSLKWVHPHKWDELTPREILIDLIISSNIETQ